jgi:hypothetical protein
MDEQYVIAFGTPFDGLELIGTFDSGSEAVNYASLYLSDCEWWVTWLQKPYEEGET